MMKLKKFASILAVALMLTACGTEVDKSKSTTESTSGAKKTEQNEVSKPAQTTGFPQLSTQVAKDERLVEMETSMGNIKIKLFPKQAPKTVENFIKHSEAGYYDGLIFHRVIKDFMIQGGDPLGTGTGGESIYGKEFEDEFSEQLVNLRGALSMANAGPNTNGSQFFIVQNSMVEPDVKDQLEKAGYPKELVEAYVKNGGTPWLDFKHTVFGQVIEGMDIVDNIANAETVENDKPKTDIIIKKINVLQ